jgi:sugar phosphate isomerase/epimerase
MASKQIGAQMYTLRDYCKTPADIATTCRKLADMGFGVVQASGLGPIEATELKKIFDDNGLKCVATHRNMDQIRDTAEMLAYHQTLDCPYTAIGGFFDEKAGPAKWKEFADEFSRLGKELAVGGLLLGYHNHSHELAPFSTDPAKINPTDVPMQYLIDQCDPSIWLEIDTYWIQHGGGDPAAWINKVAGRIPVVHFKDMTITSKREHKMCEIGAGNLNWPRIIEACKNAGVKYYLIERDNGDVDPFESLKISLENMKEMGLE